MPLRPLAGLTAVVVLLHLLALHLLPAGLPDGSAAHPTPAFAVRMVAAPVPPPPPAPRAVAPPRPAPPRPKPPVRTAPAVPPPPAVDAAAPPADAPSAPADLPGPAGTADAGPGNSPPPAPETPAAPPPPVPPAAPPPPPVGVPGSVRLLYNIEGFAKGLTYHARSELLWQQDGGRYEARLEISAFLIGSRVQTSTGRIGPAGLLPERFSDKARSEQATHFDYEGGRIVFSSNAPQVPLAPGAQDRLGLFLQLGALLAGDASRYPAGATITLPTAGPRDAADWTFAVGAPENLHLPAGDITAIPLDRAPRKDYDTRVEVWYAPALGWLPVRIRITQFNGDFIDQQLRGTENP
ncbi:MAG: DUF3108 domain-containing protein [Pseudomonadota bacterium]